MTPATLASGRPQGRRLLPPTIFTSTKRLYLSFYARRLDYEAHDASTNVSNHLRCKSRMLRPALYVAMSKYPPRYGKNIYKRSNRYLIARQTNTHGEWNGKRNTERTQKMGMFQDQLRWLFGRDCFMCSGDVFHMANVEPLGTR